MLHIRNAGKNRRQDNTPATDHCHTRALNKGGKIEVCEKHMKLLHKIIWWRPTSANESIQIVSKQGIKGLVDIMFKISVGEHLHFCVFNA